MEQDGRKMKKYAKVIVQVNRHHHTPHVILSQCGKVEKNIYSSALSIYFFSSVCFRLAQYRASFLFYCVRHQTTVLLVWMPELKRDADSSQRDPIPFPTEIPFYSFFNGWKKIGKHFVELEKVWMLNVCLFLVAFPFTFRALSLDLLPAMFFHAISFCLLALNALPTSNYKSTKTNNENQQISSKSQWLKTKRESNERHQQLAQ